MTVTFKDGHQQHALLERPKWEQPERPPTDEEVSQKFMSLASGVIGKDTAEAVVRFVQGDLNIPATGLMKLLA